MDDGGYMEDRDDGRTTGEADEATEAAVLLRTVDLHPTALTLAELIRDLAGERAEFAERDAVERAVRELVGAGLLRRSGELIMPTRAALRFGELSDR